MPLINVSSLRWRSSVKINIKLMSTLNSILNDGLSFLIRKFTNSWPKTCLSWIRQSLGWQTQFKIQFVGEIPKINPYFIYLVPPYTSFQTLRLRGLMMSHLGKASWGSETFRALPRFTGKEYVGNLKKSVTNINDYVRNMKKCGEIQTLRNIWHLEEGRTERAKRGASRRI